MNDWEKFSESSLSEKGDFYSDLTMKDITNVVHKQYKKRL